MFRVASLALASVLISSATASAGPVNLGVANGYNVFVFGDNTQYNTDAEGRVAVGGNANFSGGYTVASHLVNTNTTNLVVRGDLTISGNTVYGNVAVGGKATLNTPTINGNLNVNGNAIFTGGGELRGNLTYGGSLSNPGTRITGAVGQGQSTLPVDFDSARSSLTALSAKLAQTVGYTYGNGVTFQYGGFNLVGTNSDINVFSIRGDDLSQTNSFTINAKAGSTVVINVDGGDVRMQNLGFNLNGFDRQHVLFNFSQATALTLSGVGVQGSILAPLAAINFNNGNIDGTIVGASIAGSGESHNFPFAGDLSPIAGTVPEPASVVSTAVGLSLLAGAALRRRQARRAA